MRKQTKGNDLPIRYHLITSTKEFIKIQPSQLLPRTLWFERRW